MRKRLLSLALVFIMLLSVGMAGLAAAPGDFTDLPATDHWAYDGVVSVIENGIMWGDGDGSFRPEDTITRAEASAYLARVMNAQKKASTAGITDYEAGSWYDDEGVIAKALQMGVIDVVGGKVAPQEQLTREQAFEMMARVIRASGGTKADLVKFSDADSITAKFVTGIASLVKGGYVEGRGETIDPLTPISRQEFATVFGRLFQEYITKAGVYTNVSKDNVVVNVASVTLKDLVVEGDLYIGDGVGNGEVTLDSVTVHGRVVVRGSGLNSVHIIGNSDIKEIVVTRVDGGVAIRIDSDSHVEVVYIRDGSDEIIIEGEVGSIIVQSDIPIIINGTVNEVIVESGANVTVTEGSTVESMVVNSKGDVTLSGGGVIESVVVNADNVNVFVEKGVSIDSVEIDASNVSIVGEGNVGDVVVESGSGNKVETAGTNVDNKSDSNVGIGGDKTLDSGKTGTTANASNPPASGGGGGGGGYPQTTYTVIFIDWEGTVLGTDTVTSGGTATPPSSTPTRLNHDFSGWSGTFTNVTSDTTIRAKYTLINDPGRPIEFGDPVFMEAVRLATGFTGSTITGTEIYPADVSGITFIDIQSLGINDLSGIEYFTSLESLWCGENQLIALDVSNCHLLEILHCNGNYLTGLDVTSNTQLTELYCNNNYLNNLDVSNNPSLVTLECMGNGLASLDVTGCAAMVILHCDYNSLASLDISTCVALEQLGCGENQLAALDVSANAKLIWLFCFKNQLTALDVTNNPDLQILNCFVNRIGALDLSNSNNLIFLWCFDNLLTTLDVTGLADLKYIGCAYNWFDSTSDIVGLNIGALTGTDFPGFGWFEGLAFLPQRVDHVMTGVTAPVAGQTPVTAITAEQYTGVVTWSPLPPASGFSGNTVYTATITLTLKDGVTDWSGLSDNFFTIAGATSSVNDIGAGVVTAVFPSTT